MRHVIAMSLVDGEKPQATRYGGEFDFGNEWVLVREVSDQGMAIK